MTYEYLNRLQQFGKIEYTLCIYEEGVVIYRATKQFMDSVSDAELAAEAEKDIARLTIERTPLEEQVDG